MTGNVAVRRKVVKRGPLTRERILRAAVDLADGQGLAGLSMRGLAARLGVEAMSLYHHVRSKDELLAGALELVLAEVTLPDPEVAPKAALRSAAMSAHAAYDRHRWAAALVMSPLPASPIRFRWMESVLGALASAGLPEGLADHAYHALDAYVIGFTLWQSSIPYQSAEMLDLAQAFLASADSAGMPHTAAHIRWHLGSPDGDGRTAFESGLDLFLDGLELACAGVDAVRR
jgi:AcrR family transcriptional regulator